MNTPYETDEVWDKLPQKIQEEIISKELKFYVINASKVARKPAWAHGSIRSCKPASLPLQIYCPKKRPLDRLKTLLRNRIPQKVKAVVHKNYEAVDQTMENLKKIDYSKYEIGNLRSWMISCRIMLLTL